MNFKATPYSYVLWVIAGIIILTFFGKTDPSEMKLWQGIVTALAALAVVGGGVMAYRKWNKLGK